MGEGTGSAGQKVGETNACSGILGRMEVWQAVYICARVGVERTSTREAAAAVGWRDAGAACRFVSTAGLPVLIGIKMHPQ